MAPARGSSAADVVTFTKDWRRLQAQKSQLRGGVEATMLMSLAMIEGEHYVQQARDSILTRPITDEDKNKLFLVFNLLGKARRRKIGRVWSIAHEFGASPSLKDPKAIDQASVVTKLVKGLSRKLRENLQHWQRLAWIVDCGVVVEHSPWIEEATEEPVPAFDEETGELLWRDNANPDPNAQPIPQSVVVQMIHGGATPERFSIIEHMQVVGDVGSEIISPLNFFIDASVKTIKELGGDQACYIAQVKTVDWCKEVFGSKLASQIPSAPGTDVGIVKTRLLDKGGTPVAGLNMRDLLPAIQGSRAADDPPLCILLTRYQPSCKNWPHGRFSILTPNGPMLHDDGTPYGEIPCTDIHYEAPTRTFWTPNFITPLIPSQKFLNKRMSQMGESANASIYEVLLLAGDLDRTDIPSDMPGIVKDGLGEDGSHRVAPMQRGQLPAWFIESIKITIELLQALGSSDLTDHRQFPGQLRGPMALPMLQEILDSEDGPFYSHLGEQLAQIHQQRVNRVKQFYPGVRTMHYAGKNRKDEVLVFQTEQVLRSGCEFSITVDPSSLLPEFSALREARIIERLSGPLAGLYVNKRTGRLDFSKIASDLRYTDDESTTDRQTQYRDLALHLIARLWQAEPLSTTAPEIPYPFWDHDVMLDELEAAMATTEFLEASPQVRQEFIALYEKHRGYLSAIQEAQTSAVQSQMAQGAIAQATQQVAAKTAAETVDAAMSQFRASASMAQAHPVGPQIAQAFAANRGGDQGRLSGPAANQRAASPAPVRG